MSTYTISTHLTLQVNLMAGDMITFTRFGSIYASVNAGGALYGAGGADTVQIDGSVVNYSMSGEGILFGSGPGSSVTIGATGFIQGSNGIEALTGSNTVISYGQTIGNTSTGLYISGTGNNLMLYATSLVRGATTGMSLGGGSSVANLGEIQGITLDGLDFNGAGDALYNGGRIGGQYAGVDISVAGTMSVIINAGTIYGASGVASYAPLTLTNTGTIEAVQDGVTVVNAATAMITNSGYIFGRNDAAIASGSGADTVVNNGFLQGYAQSAFLGAGNDFFDGRNGLQFGGVYGDTGSDTLFGGAGNDFLYGGADNDTLLGGVSGDYLDGGAGFDLARYDTAAGGVTASLANSAANTGDAAGDTYFSIEGLIGSQAGDTLFGDGGDNTLYGLGGADGIAGGAGADTIYGGDGGDVIAGQDGNDAIYGQAGGDVLYGGAGTDSFVYTALADGGDFIADFNAGGVKDNFDLRPLFDSLGYAGMNPRADGLLKVLQNGADTDVYVNTTFLFRIPNLYAPALNDTYFTFQ